MSRFVPRLWTLALPRIAALAVGLISGCAIHLSPGNNAVVTMPSNAPVPTPITVTGDNSFSKLIVVVDGTNVSTSVTSTGPASASIVLPLAAGLHRIVASANVDCLFCTGGVNVSFVTSDFVVMPGSSCTQTINTPIITLDASVIATGRKPGRQKIGYALKNGHDALLILVDDAPGLPATNMLVSIDLDPRNGVTGDKEIEGWDACHYGSATAKVQASTISGINVPTACQVLTDANDFMSGCTKTAQPVLIDQFKTSALWLRRGGLFGATDEEALDSSIWQAFGGRKVRFIWRFE